MIVKNIAIITGASSGTGMLFVQALDQRIVRNITDCPFMRKKMEKLSQMRNSQDNAHTDVNNSSDENSQENSPHLFQSLYGKYQESVASLEQYFHYEEPKRHFWDLRPPKKKTFKDVILSHLHFENDENGKKKSDFLEYFHSFRGTHSPQAFEDTEKVSQFDITNYPSLNYFYRKWCPAYQLSGFAHPLNDQLDEIWVIARRKRVLEKIRKTCSHNVRVFALDLSKPDSIKTIEKALKDSREDINVRWLINNAGFGKFGRFSDISYTDTEGMIQVNCVAPVLLTHACLPYMHAGSRVINMSSAAAFLPQPYLSIYAATKKFILNYTRSLDFEIHPQGMHATAVCPKFMDTGFLAHPGDVKVAQRMEFIGFEDPRRVVYKALQDSAKGKVMCIPSFDMKLLNAACKVSPTTLAMYIQQLISSMLANK